MIGAVEAAKAGLIKPLPIGRKVEALMKGSVHTDELVGAALRKEAGLRTKRRVSHVFVTDVPSYPRPLLISDAAVNIEPTLMNRRDIVPCAVALLLAHRYRSVPP